MNLHKRANDKNRWSWVEGKRQIEQPKETGKKPLNPLTAKGSIRSKRNSDQINVKGGGRNRIGRNGNVLKYGSEKVARE